MAVEMGRRLYRGSPEDGSAVEDRAYTAAIGARLPAFDQDVVRQLVAVGHAGLVSFYRDFTADPSLVASEGRHACLHEYLRCDDARDPPITIDRTHYPRIEVRDGNSAVVFYGCPVNLGTRYFVVPEGLSAIVDGRPAGNNCFDCIPRGLSKALVVEYLIGTGELSAGRAVAVGDSPAGNDEGLTRWHRHGIPFVSVSEDAGAVPTPLADCHITRLSNARVSAAMLAQLANVEMSGPITLRHIAHMVAHVNGGDMPSR